jgi:hypothetical protein
VYTFEMSTDFKFRLFANEIQPGLYNDDYARDTLPCTQLAPNEMKLNAQNYALLTGESTSVSEQILIFDIYQDAYWGSKCSGGMIPPPQNADDSNGVRRDDGPALPPTGPSNNGILIH